MAGSQWIMKLKYFYRRVKFFFQIFCWCSGLNRWCYTAVSLQFGSVNEEVTSCATELRVLFVGSCIIVTLQCVVRGRNYITAPTYSVFSDKVQI